MLVNNAGVGLHGSFEDMSLLAANELLEVNIRSAVQLTRLLLPSVLRRRRLIGRSGQRSFSRIVFCLKALLSRVAAAARSGQQWPPHQSRILFVSSIAAAGPGADVALYAASKAFLSLFSRVGQGLVG